MISIEEVHANHIVLNPGSTLSKLNLVPNVTDAACDAAFDDYDFDGGGEIEYSEYIRYSLRDAIARSMSKVMDVFTKFDTDHSGKIEQKEFRRAIRSIGFDAPTEALDGLFNEIDKDHSGEIEFKELNSVLRVGALQKLDPALRVGAAGNIETKAVISKPSPGK